MAFSMVSGRPESDSYLPACQWLGVEQQLRLEESHLTWMLKNACQWPRLCFRIISSFVGNNPSPSLQIHSFSEDQLEGKCNKTGNPSPSISDFSTMILTSHWHILILNLFPKPIENDELSAKLKVHIWTLLRWGSSSTLERWNVPKSLAEFQLLKT